MLSIRGIPSHVRARGRPRQGGLRMSAHVVLRAHALNVMLTYACVKDECLQLYREAPRARRHCCCLL